MGPQQLEKEFTVHVYETGPDGRLDLHSLFNYMQDIASDQAVLLGFGRDDLMKSNHFWVLSRMYAEISELPQWKDKIVVKTWPCGTDKIFALRNYEVRFPDGRLIANASSSWLIIDQTTKKIQRPGELLSKYNPVSQSNPSTRSADKLSELTGEGILSSKFRVKISDLDINLHTNNVKYIKWITDTYDLNFVMHHLPCSAEINYLAESMFNEEIVIRTLKEESSNNFFGHSVMRVNDNKELCRIRLEWKPNSI
jgi:acyl-ACP thioesterase